MFHRGFFLLIVRDDALAATVSEPIQRYSVVRRARSLTEAQQMLAAQSRWSGVVVDLDSDDPDPLVTTQRLRAAHPLVPVLALASKVTSELVNGLHAVRAELVLKPVGELNLVSFVQRALVSGWLPDERVAAWVDELARRRGLTPREVQLMAYALGNESRHQVMRRLGITENTLKTQVRALLRKCGATSMDGLAKTVLRDALIFDGETPSQEDSIDSPMTGELVEDRSIV